MIDGISTAIPSFPGEAAHTRCLDHICHLCAKSLLRPFDINSGKEAQNAKDATEASLQELASGLELEEFELKARGLDGVVEDEERLLRSKSKRKKGEEEEEENQVDAADVEGSFDEMRGMSKKEREELDDVVRPVKFVLVKVSSHTFTERWILLTKYSHSSESFLSLSLTLRLFFSPHGTTSSNV